MSDWVNGTFEEFWWNTIWSGGTSIPQAFDNSIDLLHRWLINGSSTETEVSTGVDVASLTRSFDGTPGWWFSVDIRRTMALHDTIAILEEKAKAKV